jgi:hypothetical protein
MILRFRIRLSNRYTVGMIDDVILFRGIRHTDGMPAAQTPQKPL